MIVRNLFLLFITLMLGACALAPLHGPVTTSTVGEENFEFTGGISPAIYGTGAYGITDKWDFGIGLELQFGLVGSVFTKYNFLNPTEGFGLAMFAGGFKGSSVADSKGGFIGPVFGYRTGRLELILTPRYTYVDFDKADLKKEDEDDLIGFFEDVSDFHVSYLDTNLGATIWVSEQFALTGTVKYIRDLESSGDGWLFGLGFLARTSK